MDATLYCKLLAASFTIILSIPHLGCYLDITKLCMQNMNQYITQNDGQHLSLESQVEGHPVKKVSKNPMHKDSSMESHSWKEIMGLSWIFSENEGDEF